MNRPSVGEWIITGVFALIFMSLWCVGAVKDCEARTCARCEFVLGLLNYTKERGTQAIDAAD